MASRRFRHKDARELAAQIMAADPDAVIEINGQGHLKVTGPDGFAVIPSHAQARVPVRDADQAGPLRGNPPGRLSTQSARRLPRRRALWRRPASGNLPVSYPVYNKHDDDDE